MPKPIMNLDEVEFDDVEDNGLYTSRRGTISDHIGARKLGYNLTVLPPGKRAFPFHSHRMNEEMFFVVEGEGEVRIGAARYPIRKGDVIACPTGGPETAHQIINTSSAELRYLAVSTKSTVELAEYPDSGKFGIGVETTPPGGGEPQRFRFLGRPGQGLDYWDGE